jgi:HAD superfamily hydrolase (TIGR01549 family)
MASDIDVVFLDIGGPIYGDRPYYEALWKAIAEARPTASESEFWKEFEACRRDQRGPFTRRLVLRFLPPEDLDRVIDRGHQLWEYPPDSLQPDVLPALEALRETHRIGVLANQQRWIRETLTRDGLHGFFNIWIISEEIGFEKPDARIFQAAVDAADVAAERCAMVGDRLDNDIVPAKSAGMRAIWLLRGEAPDDPTSEQLARSDMAIRSLAELPRALDRHPT